MSSKKASSKKGTKSNDKKPVVKNTSGKTVSNKVMIKKKINLKKIVKNTNIDIPIPTMVVGKTKPKDLKKILYFGKWYYYRNIPDLTKQLNLGKTLKQMKKQSTEQNKIDREIDRANVSFIVKNSLKGLVVYDEVTGMFKEFSTRSNPLVVRDFLGLDRITKKTKKHIAVNPRSNLFNADKDRNINIHQKNIPFGGNDRLSINFKAVVRIFSSSNRGTKKSKSVRMMDGIYLGTLGDLEYMNHLIIRIPDLTERASFLYEYFYNEKFNEKYIGSGNFIGDAEAIHKHEIKSAFLIDIASKMFVTYGDFASYVAIDHIKTWSSASKKEFSLEKMKLLAVSHDNISINLFNDIIDINMDNNDQCVIAYLEKSHPKIGVKKFFNKMFPDLDLKEGIDTDHIIKYCKHYNINCVAYDIKRNLLASYHPEKASSSYKSIAYIAYNNHMHPIKNKYLNAKEIHYDESIIMTQSKLNKYFNKLVMVDKIIPSDVRARDLDDQQDKIMISSFVHEKKIYFTNEDYEDCKLLLSVFGIENKITPFTTRFNVMNSLEELYNIPNLNSFFPQLKNHRLGGFRYRTKRTDFKIEDLRTDDKNKMHGYALSILKFLHTVDIRTSKIVKNPTEIIDEYLYIAKPEKSTIILPKSFFYDGAHLNFCKSEGLKFELIEEIETISHPNFFAQLIEDYFTKIAKIVNKFNDDSIAKDIINIWIGKFERGCDDIRNSTYVSKICNSDEASMTDGSIIDYSDNIKLCVNTKQKIQIYSRKLISFQLKNAARRILYERMKELKLEDDDIIQINTDDVTFINKNQELKNIDPLDYKAWKIKEFTTIPDTFNYDNDDLSIFNAIDENDTEINNNILHKGYAGSGKTYTIIHNLIPSIINKSYIVVSPSHSSMEEYKKNNVNCNVIQYYEYNDIPKEDVIIVDEIGLCNKKANDMIYKCYLAGKTILSYGDFNQLLPVKEKRHFDNDIYLDLIYGKILANRKNYRNEFTCEYYDSLINEKVNLIEEIKKYRTTNYYDAEAIICYSNEAGCDKWNEKIMKLKNINFGDIGCKVMCKTNDLRKYDIYNNFMFTITDRNDEFITLKDNHKSYEIPTITFNKKLKGKSYFKPAYARTAYNVQSKSIESFYVPDSDLKYFSNGRYAYTIISRLKTRTHRTLEKSKPKESNLKSSSVVDKITIQL